MRIDQQRRLIGAVGQIETARHLTVRPRQGNVALTGERYRAFAEEGADPVHRCPYVRERGLCTVGCDKAVLLQQPAGGFMQGSLSSWDAALRELVRQSGVAALSVDYRLAPEHRFPVAFEEMVAMIRLAAREGTDLGIDPARLAVGGDSAGANLALAAAAALRNAGEGALGFTLLIYGCYSTDTESPSWQRFGRGSGLSQTQMRWIWETYLERPEQQSDWRAAPILADPAGLPPAHLIVGNLDPLLDDSHRLAARLKEAGVACELTVYDGINHGFIRYGRLIAAARRAIGDCAAALRNALIAAR